jgi:hypothetical protein
VDLTARVSPPPAQAETSDAITTTAQTPRHRAVISTPRITSHDAAATSVATGPLVANP